MYNKRFSKEPTEKQKIGQLGEDLACKYLETIGCKILERNYLKKWGELDIVTKKGLRLHFVEVKTVSREIKGDGVIRETQDSYKAEDNMHPWKLQRLGRAVQSYLMDRNISEDVEWQFDLVTVILDTKNNKHNVFLLEDIVL